MTQRQIILGGYWCRDKDWPKIGGYAEDQCHVIPKADALHADVSLERMRRFERGGNIRLDLDQGPGFYMNSK